MATSRSSCSSSSNPPNPNPSKKFKMIIEHDNDSAEFRDWAEMQRDVLAAIFERVGVIGVLQSAERVCSPWRRAAKEEAGLWRRISMGMDGAITEVFACDSDLQVMAKKAVNRSAGGLEEFWIGRFCDDALLRYTAARASNLRSLRLVASKYISDDGLVNALPNLKQLEELELTYCRVRETTLEAIGRACPRLLRFKLREESRIEIPGESEDDEAAIGISKTMHQLRYLQLVGGWISDEGVKAILQGCLNLETLDVCECYNVELGPEIRNLCTRLKRLIRPRDLLSEESDFASETGREPPEEQYDDYQDYYECDCCISSILSGRNTMMHYSGIVHPGPLVRYSRVATLRPESRGWALKLRLFNKSGQFVSMDRAKTYQRLIFIDEDGTKIQSTLFNRDIADVGNRFTTNHVYHISNAQIATVEQHFRVVDHQYQLKLSRNASIHELEQDHFKVKDDNYNFLPLCSKMIIGDTVDILAVVINVGPVKEIRKQCGETALVRHVTVIDDSLRPTLLTLWRNFAQDEGEILSRNLPHDFPIIAALFVTVNSFAGPSFSTKSRTVILIDPDMAKAKELRQWVDNNRSVVMSHMGTSLPSFLREPGESSSSASREIAESSSSLCVELKDAS